jgi:hypothetical protein
MATSDAGIALPGNSADDLVNNRVADDEGAVIATILIV